MGIPFLLPPLEGKEGIIRYIIDAHNINQKPRPEMHVRELQKLDGR